MIITRTPLRLSIGGGGTDLPSYYQRFGSFFISASIDHYVYITLNKAFQPRYHIKYSQLESVDTIAEIRHPIVREALTLHEVPPNCEIVSIADIPGGTGLGSSGSFNVGLLKALYTYKRVHVSAHALAEQACTIEIDRLGEPIGKQDQYIAAFGGITCFEIDRSGQVCVSPLRISNSTLHDLEDNLLLFYTGITRSASEVLVDQKQKTESDDKQVIENLHYIKDLGLTIKHELEEGCTARFGELMHEHWLHKTKRSAGITSPTINDLYDYARANGAIGGKLIGAGGGGFLLFYARDHNALRAAMAEKNLTEVRFGFDFQGSTVLVNN